MTPSAGARRSSRRSFLRTVVPALAGAALLSQTRISYAAEPQPQDERNSHLAWVWQFGDDGDPEQIRKTLSNAGMGIMLKTHDGTDWMSRWDNHPMAIADAQHIKSAAAYFEAMNVPFHAWCVVEGTDPMAEARMAAEVLSTGVRSLTFDLEPEDNNNYWLGDASAAKAFGEEVRRLAPKAKLTVAPDPRPWQLKDVPIAEFAAFCDDIAPQTYWESFHSEANDLMFSKYGTEVGPDGVTPELILDVSRTQLIKYNLPLKPVGQGASAPEGMTRFLSHAGKLGMDQISVWRYGTTTPEVWPLLGNADAPARAGQIAQTSQGGVTEWLERRGASVLRTALAR